MKNIEYLSVLLGEIASPSHPSLRGYHCKLPTSQKERKHGGGVVASSVTSNPPPPPPPSERLIFICFWLEKKKNEDFPLI